MKEYINNGPDVHPGANYIIRPDGRKIRVYDETKETVIENLEPGYIVERHIIDGDIVLFNRQPSLHRMSMMDGRRITSSMAKEICSAMSRTAVTKPMMTGNS